METLSGCECDGEVGCSARDCDAKVLRRPAGVSPEEWRRRQAAELRAIVRRSLLQGAADPFR